MFFVLLCDITPGSERDLDRFLVDKLRAWWISQSGVKSFHIYRNALDEGFSTVDPDALTSAARRVILIEVADLSSLQRILDTDERAKLRRELLTYLTNIESQLQELII